MGSSLPFGARLVLGLAAAGVGLAGAPPEPLGLAWLALVAAPAGTLAGGLGRAGLAVPAVWAGWLLAAGLPWAAAAVLGLVALGAAVGTRRPTTRVADAGVLLLLGAALAGLPSLGGVAGHAPWSPKTTAVLLDLSPVVLVVECAGVDWLRHPAVYGPAGGDAIGPVLRGPWSGPLAGSVSLLVGCLLLAGARVLPSPTGEPCPNPASSSAPSPRS